MGLNTAGINAILDSGNDVTMWAAIGSGPTSGDQTSAARVQVTFSVAGGVLTATNVPMAFTGAAAAGATHCLLFSANAAGTFYGFDAITGDQAFNAAGQYELTALTITGSSPT